MALTWRQLIRLTVQDLRIYGTSAFPSPDDEAAVLSRLNDWIDQLKLDGAALYQLGRITWPIVPNQPSYTVGLGAQVNIDRPPAPSFISGVGFIRTDLPNNPEFGVNPPLNIPEWSAITFKTFFSLYPARWYYEPTTTGVTMTGTISPYPIPTSAALQGVIYAGIPIQEVTTLTATIFTPPGYRLWIRKAVRIEAADALRAAVDPNTMQRWIAERDEAAARVRRVNERLEEISFGFAGRVFGRGRRPSNIYTGN